MMKKKILLIIIILVVLLGILLLILNHHSKEVELNESFQVSLHQTVTLKNHDLVIQLVSVSDSRCKEGQQCIWAGEIEYNLKVNNKKIVLSTVRNTSTNYKDYEFVIDKNNDSTKYISMKVTKE